MPNKFHKDLSLSDVHVVYSYSYANAAARSAATGFASADIGKIARQLDDNTFYILKATTPTWTQIDSVGAVASVNGQSGVVTLDTDDIPEGTAKFFTAALAKAAAVADAIANGVTDVAPSQNAVFDALALKVDAAGAKAAAVADAISNGVTDVAPSQNVVFDALALKQDAAGAVTSVNSQTGAVVLDTDDVSEGTNKYFSSALAKAATVADVITDGVTDVAPSQNAVFDALAVKVDAAGAKAAAVADAIVDAVTDVAPSQNAVFDALATKAATSHGHTSSDISDFATAAKAAAVADSITDGVTNVAPSQNAVFDALALKANAFLPAYTRYVDGVNGLDTNSGSIIAPFKTIQAALTNIGPSSGIADFATDANSRWRVCVEPGVYTENLTIPTRRHLEIELNGSLIIGDVTQTLVGATHGQVGNYGTKLIFSSRGDFRNMHTGIGVSNIGIQGNILCKPNSGSNFIPEIHLYNVGVTGNVTFDTFLSGYNGQLLCDNAIVQGNLVATGAGVLASMYVTNSFIAASRAFGGVSGFVHLANLVNVRFINAVVASGNAGGRWINVQFKNGAGNSLSGYTGTIEMDGPSRKSYLADIPTKGSETITMLDDSFAQQSLTRWVDTANGVDTNNGAPSAPFKTIQAALTSLGNTASAADVKKPIQVFIQSGAYDEDITIPTGRICTLYAMGTVILGAGTAANWGSTTARSVNWNVPSASVFGSDVKPALNIIGMPGADATSTFIMESGVFRISGNINATGDGLTNTLNLSSVRVDGTVNFTNAALTNFQAYRSLFNGAISTNGNLVLERAYDCRFNALVQINAYNMVGNCNFLAGMTVTSIQQNVIPNGMFFTSFTGTFTGIANSLRLDRTSNFYFQANSAVLAGGATKVLLDGPHFGATGSRPSGIQTGYQYYDTTISKPIWWSGSAWLDATGAAA